MAKDHLQLHGQLRSNGKESMGTAGVVAGLEVVAGLS